MKFQAALLAFVLIVALTMHAEAERVKICEPKSVFMDDCNRCRCSEDGFDKSCTRIMCVKKPGNEIGRTKRDLEHETCEPGSVYMMDCNLCVCPETGVKYGSACTLQACLEDFIGDENCIPGSKFKIDCNNCICPPSGKKLGAYCTLMICP